VLLAQNQTGADTPGVLIFIPDGGDSSKFLTSPALTVADESLIFIRRSTWVASRRNWKHWSLVDACAHETVEASIIPPDRPRALLVAEAELGERIACR
jgi:hypothetical protein